MAKKGPAPGMIPKTTPDNIPDKHQTKEYTILHGQYLAYVKTNPYPILNK